MPIEQPEKIADLFDPWRALGSDFSGTVPFK
jgi:hypothetical protein